MWPKIISFDCYGTLVQWPETLRTVFTSLLGNDADGTQFHQDFSKFHVQIKSEPYRPYSVVLRLSLAETMKKWGLGNIASAQQQLLDAVHSIMPYPEVVPALRSIAKNYRLVILSNTEDALIAGTVRGLQVKCEVITAQQARAYKPDHRLFEYAYGCIGVTPGEVLHVGAGYATDMVPAFELGIARIWINRRGEQGDSARPPTAVLSDLSGLEAAIESIAVERNVGRSGR